MTAPEAPKIQPPRWQWCRFETLTLRQLHDIHQARQQVFSVEQNCAYLDVDGHDENSHHLVAWWPAQRGLAAYARVVHPGLKYAEASIGRVITTASARGMGLGRELVRRAIVHTREAFPDQGIRISAQSRLEAFYADAGFVRVGDPYLEDGIPHTEMWLAR